MCFVLTKVLVTLTIKNIFLYNLNYFTPKQGCYLFRIFEVFENLRTNEVESRYFEVFENLRTAKNKSRQVKVYVNLKDI